MLHNNIDIVLKAVKNFNLKIKPSGEVILTAPLTATAKEIDCIIDKRANWIKKHLELFAKHKQPKSELVSGENFAYLGKAYRLKVSSSTITSAKLSNGYLQLSLPDKNDYAAKQAAIKDWYATKATIHFQRAIDKFTPIVKIVPTIVRIKTMQSRWGSCNTKQRYINLNLELIKKPKVAIEYVVFHEMTHLIYPNHSKHFYNYMALYMPDWKNRKLILEKSPLH